MGRGKDCKRRSLRWHGVTTYQVFSGIDVPDETVLCGGMEVSINYAHIVYSCIDSELFRYLRLMSDIKIEH